MPRRGALRWGLRACYQRVEVFRTQDEFMAFKTLSDLLALTAGLQKDLGLGELAPLERDIAVVIGGIWEAENRPARTEEISRHPALAEVSRSTLHRALRNLLQSNVIAHAEGTRAGRYILHAALIRR
jgi:hypothetical protein